MNAPKSYADGVSTGDFDHTSPEHAKVWKAIYGEMRGCPLAWSNHHDGYWVATRYKDVVSVGQSPQFDSSKEYDEDAGKWRGGNIIPPFPVPPLMPVEADNEVWRPYRTFLNRRFSANAVEAHRPTARGFARSLVDRIIARGSADMVDDLTNPLPSLVIMTLFGFPLENWNDFAEPVHKAAYYTKDNPDYPNVVAKMNGIFETLTREAQDRRRTPRDDLMSYLANGEVDGRPLSIEEAVSIGSTLIFAGVDTTTALTSNALHHLGSPQGAEDRKRLIAEPALRPLAREEFARFFSPVQGVARRARADVDLGGTTIGGGHSILLALSSANQDGTAFDAPEELRIDRQPNRHVGFGVGMHLCLGKFLAQVMFDAMLDEVLERMPDYRVEPGEQRYPSIDQVNGWSKMPISFTPGPVLGDGLPI